LGKGRGEKQHEKRVAPGKSNRLGPHPNGDVKGGPKKRLTACLYQIISSTKEKRINEERCIRRETDGPALSTGAKSRKATPAIIEDTKQSR